VTRSLGVRLTAAVVLVLAAVLAGFAIIVHLILDRALVRQLDLRLSGSAAAVAGMAEDEPGGPEFEAESLPEFERGVRPGYFEAWVDDGHVLARSPSLGTRDLPRVRDGAPSDVVLPDGRPGRAVQLRQPLRVEDARPGAAPSKRFVTVVAAVGTEETRETLATVSRWLWALGLAAFGAAAGATLVLVRRGLRPARAVAAEIERLDADELDRPLATAGLPAEIEPIVTRLNQLLARLSASFARERRFTADVSHELRTPLSALRTTLEVAAAHDRPAASYRAAIAEATALAVQMQALIANLLLLARLDARQIDLATERVDLRQLVDDCWRAFEAAAAGRRLTFANQLPADLVVDSDPEKLRIVLANLLANAAAYTAAGGSITVRAGAGDTLLDVSDSGPPIPDELLPRIFDRFSRGDPARAGGVHCGIGLALVRGVCAVLGLEAAAHNTPEGGVSFRVTKRPAARGQEGQGEPGGPNRVPGGNSSPKSSFRTASSASGEGTARTSARPSAPRDLS
jgi:two-component system, OmpR family, heavy metal sensor histidine kinase CusS